MRDLPGPGVVTAAQRGDRRALDELVGASLPLVYSVVQRTAERDLDVDDIVQETMLRLVTRIETVQDPQRFRSWVMTIALRQLAEARQAAGHQRMRREAEVPDRADASVDVERSVAGRHLLSAEQREIARSSEWLDEGYRPVLALWWLEARGELSRADLADALGEPVAHAGVRLQRMREQLAVARSVVRVLGVQPRCRALDEVLTSWDGVPSPLWRKRISRHVRACAACGAQVRLLSSPDRLLAGLPLLVPSPALTARIGGGHLPPGVVAVGGPGAGVPGPAVHAAPAGKAGVLSTVTAKVAAAAVAAVLAGAGAMVALPHDHRDVGSRQVIDALPGTAQPSLSLPSPSAPPSPATSTATSPGVPDNTFRDVIPAFPSSSRVTDAGTVRQNARVDGRDNGQSTGYDGKSVWIFDDTTLRNPWGFLSNSAAVTGDLDASDGVDLRSGSGFTVRNTEAPAEVVPRTATEKAYEKAHPGVRFAFWPGPVIADPQRHRVLFTYGKLCRGGAPGTPCTGPMGHGIGMGVAAMDMRSGSVRRLTVRNSEPVTSEEGPDPTLFSGPAAGIGSAAALTVDGKAYLYGDCGYGCRLARVDLAKIDDRSAWRFYAGGRWVGGPAEADHLIGQGGAGQTVFYSAGLRAYVNVFLPFGSNTVKYQVGGAPFGPWSKERVLYQTRGGEGAKNYALFAHPEYAGHNGLVQYLTYFDPATGDQRLLRWTMTR